LVISDHRSANATPKDLQHRLPKPLHYITEATHELCLFTGEQ
jgi:hypothetical protein